MPPELQHRTVRFAVSVYKFVRPMFRDADTRYIADQLLRAATSLASHHRAAGGSRSNEEWAEYLALARRDADEARFWLGFIADTDTAPGRTVDLKRLTEEADEVLRVLASPYRPGAAAEAAAPSSKLLGSK
jgi:four helix bundle protein